MQKKKNRPQDGSRRPLPRKMRKKHSQKVEPAVQPSVEGQAEPIKADKPQAVAQSQSPKQESESQWKKQYEDLNRKYQFLMAEYANYKKQSWTHIERLRKYEGQDLIRSLLDQVVDNFDLALQQKLTNKNSEEFKKGVQMIYKQLKSFLKSAGIKEVAQIGEPFNPAFHNALDSLPTKDMPPDHILHIIKKAYMFHDKLIRPAEVIVSRQSQSATEKQSALASEESSGSVQISSVQKTKENE